MEIYVDEIDMLINNFWQNQLVRDSDKFEEMQEYYNKIIREKLKPRDRGTHIALLHCKSFDEIAEEFTKKERKKRSLKPDSIRKRRDRIIKIIKDNMSLKYE